MTIQEAVDKIVMLPRGQEIQWERGGGTWIVRHELGGNITSQRIHKGTTYPKNIETPCFVNVGK